MTDRAFGIFMALAIAVLIIIMSTPLTMRGLQDVGSKLRHRVSSTEMHDAPTLASLR